MTLYLWSRYNYMASCGVCDFSRENKMSLGLIVDWMELLDPEIDSLSSDLQDKLLFGVADSSPSSPSTSEISKASLAGPAYLRSLLAHQSRWSTIRQTIHRLLDADDIKQWSPAAVLDFLVVCIGHPKLYQGRELRKPKVCELFIMLRKS